MINKELEKISKDDLMALVNNSVIEKKTLEYKLELKINRTRDKKEFLADLSSFANASGGDILFGIKEINGKPVELIGLDVNNTDEEILKIEHILQNGIQPKLPSYEIHTIELENTKILLIIRIFKSWISPHRVIYDSHDKFYTRSTNGKHQMDVTELRIAFNLTETLNQQIRRFREERISSIISNDTPIPLRENPRLLLHLIPFVSFSPGKRIDLNLVTGAPNSQLLYPISNGICNERFNFDGYLVFFKGNDNIAKRYTQLFKNGIVETVESSRISNYSDFLIIPQNFEQEIIDSIKRYIELYKILKIELPVIIFLSLLGVKGYTIESLKVMFPDQFENYKIEKENLFIPEVVLESFSELPEQILKPIFDTVWNACGYKSSSNYDENGEWKPKY